MSKRGLCFGVFIGVLALAGCHSNSWSGKSHDPAPSTRIGDTISVSLDDLLKKPRAELAGLADDCFTKIQVHEKARREGTLHFILLPNIRLPLVVPVWREAKYSAKVGFSLPPYVSEQSKDVQLALHLARFGDIEAARKLADGGDSDTLQQIEAWHYERAYPLEWTRLVGLMLHAAEIRLATGDVDGATEIVVLHRQLRKVLDAKAAKGPLGAELLARGHETLVRAAAAWREENNSELAAQADSLLGEWGPTPAVPLAVERGASRAQLKHLLGSLDDGRAIAAATTIRALDVLALPFPEDGVEAVMADFDDADRLADVFITYRAEVSDHFPKPSNLAHLLEDRSLADKDSPETNSLCQRSYRLGDWACEVSIVTHGAGVGALVHIGDGKQQHSKSPLSRDFGAFHLDRSFEQNRLRLVPGKRGDTLATSQPKTLAAIKNPLADLKPEKATIQRDNDKELTAGLTLAYPTEVSGPPVLHRLVLPLLASAGPPVLQGVSDGGYVALVWEDGQTRYTLRLPYEGGQPVLFEANDLQGSKHAAEREARTAAFDRAQRKARFAAGKPLARLQRHLEQVLLGMTRNQVLQVLPAGKAIFKQDIPDGLSVTFNGDPGYMDTYVLRQLLIRFDSAERAVELRARYVDGPAIQDRVHWTAQMLGTFKDQLGVPENGSASWATVWTDLPPQEPAPRFYRWRDDTTLLTYQRDGWGVELVLRDCPLEHENGVPLPRFEYLPRGPQDCLLGARRAELLQKWRIAKPNTTDDGALILRPDSSSSYDALLVWFQKDRASRIVARHTPFTSSQSGPLQWGQAVSDAWGRDLPVLGWPRRQDLTATEALQGLGWNDERTRVRIFWQEGDRGSCHLFTEWKDLP